jgi:glyoxylase-like metal-dependent hydrolase (beta-lactamase superfamily II)
VKISSHVVGAFQENAYLVVDDSTERAVLVDPGAEGARLVAAVEASGAELEAIWLTHAHVDHVGAIAAVRRRWDVPVLLHPADDPLWRAVDRQAAAYGIPFDSPPPDYRPLADGDELRVGSAHFRVMHTPGHAPGHCVFVGKEVVLAGDLLFAGSIGRTDLPLSDPPRMQDSLALAMTLDDALTVYPGHGPASTIGAERQTNPFLNGVARVLSRR